MNTIQKWATGFAAAALSLTILTVGPGLKSAVATVAPTTGPSIYPTLAATLIPVSLSTTVPATVSTTAPVNVSTTTPVTGSTTVPVSQSTTIPVTQATTVAVSQSTTVPSTQSTTVPATISTTAPVTLSTTAPVTGSTTVPVTQATTVAAVEPTTAATTVPLYGSTSDAANTAMASTLGATHAWPMDDASSTQFGWNDTIGTSNITFSEGNTTGWATCFGIVDASNVAGESATLSTQFNGSFAGTASSNVTLSPTTNWSVLVSAIPSALSNYPTIWQDDNPISHHQGAAVYMDSAGLIHFALGYGGSYQQLSSGVDLSAQTITAFTQSQPIIASWNASTYTMSISVGNSTIATKTLGGAYTAGAYGLSFITNPYSQSTLTPWSGYIGFSAYFPSVLTQAQIYTVNYALTGPVHP